MKAGDLRIKGKWWRHSAYILRDGYVVPAPGARISTYDIFEEYREKIEDARVEPDAPYVELAGLTQGTDADVLRWCQTYGLLGIIPHELVAVDFTDHRSWARYGSSWKAVNLVFTPSGPLKPSDYTKEGLVRLLGDPTVTTVGKALLPFFPTLPQDEPIPVPPCTENFWSWYAEPVDRIRSYARTFHRILSAFTPPTPGGAPEQWDAWGMREAWMDWLANHGELRLNGDSEFPWKGPHGSPVQDDIAPALASPNLISSLAVMLWQDLTGGANPGTCDREGCGKVFVTRRDKREYCSPACRSAAAAKRYRLRKKVRELHAAGINADEIVGETGLPITTVLEYLKEE